MAESLSAWQTAKKKKIADKLAAGTITADQAAKRTAATDKKTSLPKERWQKITGHLTGDKLAKHLSGGGSGTGKNIGKAISDAVGAYKTAAEKRGAQFQPIRAPGQQSQPSSGMSYGGGFLNDIGESDSWQTIHDAAAASQPTEEQHAANESALIGGRYDPTAPSNAQVRNPYVPTTKAKIDPSKITTPGELTGEDIQALNKYQISLENKQKTKGLNKAEADKLDDYYAREIAYRNRGFADEPEALGRNSRALEIDPKTGLTKGITPAKAAAPKVDPTKGWIDAGTGKSGLGDPPKVKPPKASAKPSVAAVPSGGKAPMSSGSGGKAPTSAGTGGAAGGGTSKGGRTPAQQAAIDAATAKKYPQGPTAKRLAAVKKANAISAANAKGNAPGVKYDSAQAAKNKAARDAAAAKAKGGNASSSAAAAAAARARADAAAAKGSGGVKVNNTAKPVTGTGSGSLKVGAPRTAAPVSRPSGGVYKPPNSNATAGTGVPLLKATIRNPVPNTQQPTPGGAIKRAADEKKAKNNARLAAPSAYKR